MDFHKQFTFDYKQILIDEIALNGLEGISIGQLWKHTENRISSPVTEKMKARFWNFIVHCNSISFYQVPEPLCSVEIVDRFTLIHQDSGNLIDPDYYIDGPYEYCAVENDYGSCANYKTRGLIPHDYIQNLSYEDVVAKYGDTLAMVATIEERWQALAPHLPITYLSQLTPLHYCMLELIGKGRQNGQMTVGMTNLTKIVKDAKFLFYIRKQLQKLDLVRVQTLTQVTLGRGIKSLLLRLKRFHQPSILSMPKSGKLYDLIEYLLQKPDYSERTDEIIRKGLLTQHLSKRLQKTINLFKFSERQVQPEHSKKYKNAAIKKRFISLTSKSDESSQSDDENIEEPLKSQYKVGVGILRQAYETLLEAGRRGLTQVELAQLLNVEFYTSRAICRLFKKRNIIREFLEDKGRQRTAKFITIASTGEMDIKYTEEKKKLLEYICDSSKLNNKREIESSQSVAETEEVPKKKAKIENSDINTNLKEAMKAENIEAAVAELSVLDGIKKQSETSLLNSKKNLTLRQLKYANGLLKVTRERLYVTGYQTLSNLVAKEIGEPPMDTKALKIFIQKLVTEGHIKILKLKWPEMAHKYSILICAPHVKGSDPIVKAKYKEITIRAYSNIKSKMKKKLIKSITRPLSQFAYPRYMKIQKLHEFLVNFVYFRPVKTSNDLPEGFASLIWIMPEITVEFAVGNISNVAISDIADLKISDDLLEVKLRDAPDDLYRVLLQSQSLLNSLKANLRTLAMLGLIQLIHQHSQSYDCNGGLSNYLFYINRHAKIIDTTGVWPRKVADMKSLEKRFYFETFDDVQKYWGIVYDISTSTKIETADRGRRKNIYPPVRVVSEVKDFDNGECFGDGLGPCGFDSCYFMDLPRLWRSFYFRVIRPMPTTKKKPQINIPKRRTIKKKPAKPKKKKKPRSTVVRKEKQHPIAPLRTKRSEATVKWSTFEDKVLTMCKAAITVMSPTSQPGCLRLRNIVAKDILSLTDPKKTSGVCHKRVLTLESNTTLAHFKEIMLNELRRRPDLTHKYEGLLKKLRLNYATNMSKYLSEARIPMMELLWLILEIDKSKSFRKRIPCVAMNLEDFNEKFAITMSSGNRLYDTYYTPVDSEPVMGTIKEGIILVVMQSFHNVPTSATATKVFNIFSAYPERVLRIALDELRKCGAVAAKEKILNGHLEKFRLRDVVHSNYKISANYQRRWISRLNAEFVENVANNINAELATDNLKGSPELNCLFCELQAMGVLDLVSITIPAISGSSDSIMQEEKLNVLDVEINYKLNSGTVGWKSKRDIRSFSEIYQDFEAEDCLQSFYRSSIVQESNIANVSTTDEISSYLIDKSTLGATFKELLEKCRKDYKSLLSSLEELESKNIVKRVGYYENRIVLREFIEPWSIESRMIPTPWLTLNCDIRQDILLNWTGVVMNKIFELPGITMSQLSESFKYLTPRAAQDICVFLEECKCIKLNVTKMHEPDLFSEDDVVPESIDFNPYESPDDILAFPLTTALSRYAYVRKVLLDKYRSEK